MRKSCKALRLSGLILALILIFFGQILANSEKVQMMKNLASMPLAFTENQGQFSDKMLFKANAGGATFYFCSNEVAYLFVRNTDELLEDDMLSGPDMPDKFNRLRYKKESLLIKAQFVGANPNPEMIAVDRLQHNSNYFCGNDPSKYRTDVPNYSTIVYKDIYPGIDLKYYGNGKSMKSDFIVNPGADISQIQIRYDGVMYLCDKDIDPNKPPKGQACWTCDQVLFTRGG